ncbi:MAG: DUF4143 domain-containing protein [Pseudomonadota bacterium]
MIRDLLIILPQRIGSPLSINALREDLNCAHSTMKRYIKALNQVFISFEICPYFKDLKKIIKKEKKLYFFYFIVADDAGKRFENMIALLLLKWVSSMNEQTLGDYSLNYLRDQSRREVDFVLLKDNKPLFLIEAKLSDVKFTSASLYYHKLLNIPIMQLVRKPEISIKRKEGIVLSVHKLASLVG